MSTTQLSLPPQDLRTPPGQTCNFRSPPPSLPAAATTTRVSSPPRSVSLCVAQVTIPKHGGVVPHDLWPLFAGSSMVSLSVSHTRAFCA